MNEFQNRNIAHNSSFDVSDTREHDILRGKAVFDPENPALKKEILGLIAEYLYSQDMSDSVTVLQEEGNIMLTPHANFIQTASLTSSEFQQQQMIKNSLFNKSKKHILEGDWDEVEKLCLKYAFKNHKNFLFDVYKQKYFELLERQEFQTAYTHLINKMKPLEAICSSHVEFSDLCYLLSCKSVKEANLQTTDPEWDKTSAREKLVSELESLLGLDTKPHSDHLSIRLLALIRQAVAFQIETNHLYPKSAPTVKQLSQNYHGLIVPNKLRQTLTGHTDNVKCVEFLGEDGGWIVSGSSDNTLRLWPLQKRHYLNGCITLTGHNSRIWDVATTRNTNTVATASGDETIKIWKLDTGEDVSASCVATLNGHKGDIYTIRFHPDQHHVVTGGYDKTVRLFDVNTGQMKRLFSGHNSSVSRAIFNPSGNLIISGSKDSTIKFWDIRSSVCVKTISSHLGEVTSIEINSSGTLLLSASKDNCNRLWETGTARPIIRFKGHQNTSKNFVRATFGADEALVIGGSEDGMIYVWDVETGSLLHTLAGHTGMVYATRWNQKKGMLASCSHDNTVKTWIYDPDVLVNKSA